MNEARSIRRMVGRAVLVLALPVAAVSLTAACGSDDDDAPLEPTYANVEALLLGRCAFSDCHGGTSGAQLDLNFAAIVESGMPLTSRLNGVASCEYDAMPLVDPGNPDNSWLMVKLDPAHAGPDRKIQFVPAPGWMPNMANDDCPLRDDDGNIIFGNLMPNVSGQNLDPDELTLLREWILMGALGP